MPKPWTEIVQSFPVIREGKAYLLRIKIIEKADGGREILVTLEHIDDDHQGQLVQARLSLPIRPRGLAAEFFAACNQKVEEGTRINPKEALGQIVGAKFRLTAANVAEIISFEPIKKEESDVRQSAE